MDKNPRVVMAEALGAIAKEHGATAVRIREVEGRPHTVFDAIFPTCSVTLIVGFHSSGEFLAIWDSHKPLSGFGPKPNDFNPHKGKTHSADWTGFQRAFKSDCWYVQSGTAFKEVSNG